MNRSLQSRRDRVTCLAIPIETKVRELDAKVFMACVAAERGFRVILGGYDALSRRVACLPCGSFYLEKSIQPGRALRFRAYLDIGLRIVAWCEEGLAFIDPEEYLRRRVDSAVLAETEWFFAWGPYQADLIRRAAPALASRVIEAGNPRMDLLKKPLAGAFRDEADRLRATYPGLILVNTNFSLCNHQKGPGVFLASLKAEGKVKTPEEERFAQGWVDHKQVLFEAFRRMIPALSHRFPDRTIVVRPHPSEDHETWRRLAEPLPNVKVLHEGNVVPWLLAADALVHNGCTTGFEAHLLGRPVFAYQPVTSEDYDTHLPNRVSVCAATLPALLEALAAGLDGTGTAKNPDARRVVAAYLAHPEGGAADAIVDHLWAQRKTAKPLPLRRRGLRLLRRLIRRWLERGRPSENVDHYEIQKFPGLTLAELRRLHQAYRSETGRFNDVGIREPWPGCFEFHAAATRGGHNP